MSKTKTVEFVAFIDGEQVSSTGKYDFIEAHSDEFMTISNELSCRLMESLADGLDTYELDENYLDERNSTWTDD